MLKVFEAFAGVGSQRMALRNLGIEHKVVGICEIDKFALKSYEAIHGDCPNFGDISKVDPDDLPNMDLFTYSFPCQDLSVAGKRKGLGEGTRSGLLYECEKIIEVKKPKYLLLENVKNLVGKKFKNDFDEWLKYLENLGYKNYWKVLNAKDYGVPQNRERVFVVSILNDKQGYEFPKPVNLIKCIKDILEDEVDEKFYMNKPFKFVNRKNEAAELEIRANRECRVVQDERMICPTLTTMGGGHREPKIIEVAKMTNINFDAESRVYSNNGIMATLQSRDCRGPKKILVKDGYSYRVRKLTPLECWRLMSFSDEDYYKAKNIGISNSQLYKQAGNSIVVKVLEGIFENLFLNKSKENEIKTIAIKLKNKNTEYNQLKWII